MLENENLEIRYIIKISQFTYSILIKKIALNSIKNLFYTHVTVCEV